MSGSICLFISNDCNGKAQQNYTTQESVSQKKRHKYTELFMTYEQS